MTSEVVQRAMTREVFEKALDSERAEIQTAGGKWYRIRRNGKTYLPKRKVDMWHVPVKWGLKQYARIDLADLQRGFVRIKQEGAESSIKDA